MVRAPLKSTENPDLPVFSGELPTPNGEPEIDNYVFQLKLLRSSYTEDAIRNAIVATVRSHAKIAIRVIGYDSSLAAMIDQLENRFSAKETTDILLQEFHQMMMSPKEKVHEFGGKLEYKFRLLQERCPGRYNMAQLKDRLFHGMTDKLRDSVYYLFTNPTVDFNQLLKAAMTCELENTSRAVTKAKAMQFSQGVSESTAVDSEINSIRSQLEQMSTILKGANFKGTKDSNKKKGNNQYKPKQDVKGFQSFQRKIHWLSLPFASLAFQEIIEWVGYPGVILDKVPEESSRTKKPLDFGIVCWGSHFCNAFKAVISQFHTLF